MKNGWGENAVSCADHQAEAFVSSLHFFEKLSDYRYMGKTRNYSYAVAGNSKVRTVLFCPGGITEVCQVAETANGEQDLLWKVF